MFPRKKTRNIQLACPNVILPDTIPAFFIPPSLATWQGRHSSGLLRASESPARSSGNVLVAGQEGGQAGGRLPRAASTFPFARPEGLAYLPESPNTRRRESLFHGGRPPCDFPGAPLSPRPAGTLAQPGRTLDSDTPSSAETSPYNSPRPLRPLGSPCLPFQGCGPRRRFAGRPANAGPAPPRPSSLSLEEETSSTDTSPSCPRREAEARWSAPAALPLDSVRCCERRTKEVLLTVSQGGRLRLSSEYLQPQRRLRIRLVCAEAFYPPHCEPRHIHCCVSLALRPGPRPRQRSATVKRSRNPIFNEDFFFEGLSPEELRRCSLRLKVFNTGSGLRRELVLGKCDVPLDSVLPPAAGSSEAWEWP